MAVNTFTFGSITSSTYGIYVSGEGLFNAPKRDTEIIQIPGRDGAYILDKGSFENIEVTYRVFNQEKDLTDFRTKLSNLRSALCSQIGYQRLTDTFHPDEYRMAAFIDGIEVNPVKYNTASEFEIKFNCKPQRFLTSGETAVSVASGGAITNPTLFEAKPQLQVYGYGDISIGSQNISVANVPIGMVMAFDYKTEKGVLSVQAEIDTQYANAGDRIILQNDTFFYSYFKIDSGVITSPTQQLTVTGDGTAYRNTFGSPYMLLRYNLLNNTEFVYGTSSTKSATVVCPIDTSNYSTITLTSSFSVSYDGADTFTLTMSHTVPTHLEHINNSAMYDQIRFGNVFIDSTQSSLGNPMYIDLDIGEAYKIENGSAASVNNSVTLPAELPTLASGINTITYDNTFTSFKVVPRWWKV